MTPRAKSTFRQGDVTRAVKAVAAASRIRVESGRRSRPSFEVHCDEGKMTARALSDVRPVPRRGLSRNEAAMYIGISPSKFDELVADGRMPGPVKIDSRKIWDIRHLDLAFDALSMENPGPNSWEGV
jgi:predicted DNA-binding transcriptional regulator AlpA